MQKDVFTTFYIHIHTIPIKSRNIKQELEANQKTIDIGIVYPY